MLLPWLRFTALPTFFSEGVKLEYEHEWLPPIRRNMLRTQEAGGNDRGVLHYIVLFYIGGTAVLLTIAGLFLIGWLYKFISDPNSIFDEISCAVVFICTLGGSYTTWNRSLYRKAFSHSLRNLPDQTPSP